MYWIYKALRHYADFSGRAGKREYWSFFLFVAVVDAMLGVFYQVAAALTADTQADPTRVAMLLLAAVLLLVGLSLVVPSISAMVRRLHDLNKSGLWALLLLLPLVGELWLVVLLASEGTRGPNRFGEKPEEAAFEAAPEEVTPEEVAPEEVAQPDAEEPAGISAPSVASVTVTGLALSQAEAAFGEAVTAEVEYQNPADEDCVAEVRLYLNGVVSACQVVEVSASACGKAEMPVPYGFVGEYEVKAGGYSRTLVVG